MGRGQPSTRQTIHPRPLDATSLAAPSQDVLPQSHELATKYIQRRPVARHAVITEVPDDDRPQPLAHFRERVMHALPQLQLDNFQLRLHALSHRLPQDGEAPFPRRSTDVREPQKVERLRLAFAARRSVGRCIASKLNQARLVRVQFQLELVKSGY